MRWAHSNLGKKTVTRDCPCGVSFTAYVWSLAGSGKLCPGCGAKHGSGGIIRHSLETLPKEDKC